MLPCPPVFCVFGALAHIQRSRLCLNQHNSMLGLCRYRWYLGHWLTWLSIAYWCGSLPILTHFNRL